LQWKNEEWMEWNSTKGPEWKGFESPFNDGGEKGKIE